jgi:hypothetical protein
VLVAHACIPSYLVGRDQEDQFEASLGKYLMKPHLEKAHHKKQLVEGLKV